MLLQQPYSQDPQRNPNLPLLANQYNVTPIQLKTIFYLLTSIKPRTLDISSTSTFQKSISYAQFLYLFPQILAQQTYTFNDHQYKFKERHLIVTAQLFSKIQGGIKIYNAANKELRVSPNYIIREYLIDVYEFIVPEMFEKKKNFNQNIPQFRKIAMFVLYLLLGKSVSFLDAKQLKQQRVGIQKAQQLVELIYDNFQRSIKLRYKAWQQILYASRDEVNYILILNRIFKENCKGLTWKQLAFLLLNRGLQPKELALHIQLLFYCEDNQTRQLLIYAKMAECNDQRQYILTQPVLYLQFLKRSYRQRGFDLKKTLRELKESIGPQAFVNAINEIEQKGSRCRAILEGPMINEMSKEPYILCEIDKENQPHFVKLFVNYSVEDHQLIRMILQRRQFFSHCLPPSQHFIEIRGGFKHPRLAVNCPILSIQKILEIPFLQDRKIFLLHFLDKIFRGESCYLYSLENVWLNQGKKQFHFSQSSIVGIMPFIKKNFFRRKQIKQVYELLDQKMFGEAENRQHLFTYKSKFRAIAMFILYLVFGQRVSLLKERDFGTGDKVSFQNAKKLVMKIPDRFRKFLYKNGNIKTIQRAGIEDKANYLVFLRKVFEDNCEGLEWKQLGTLLYQQQKLKTVTKLSQILRNSALGLYRKEDENSNRLLVQLGVAKEIRKSQFELKDTDLYLHYLLSNASFSFRSIADQISQQCFTIEQQNPAFKQQVVKLVNQFYEAYANNFNFPPKKQRQRQEHKHDVEEVDKNNKEFIHRYEIVNKKHHEPSPNYEQQGDELTIKTSYDEKFDLLKMIYLSKETGSNAKIVRRYMSI